MKKLLVGIIFSSALTLIGITMPASAISNKEDIETPETYTNHTINQPIDIDRIWGCQCVDLFTDFHYAYTRRWLSTAGTGVAYGLWDAREYNAGNDYELITNHKDLQPGDWIIFSGGEYGHVGMAVGYYDNGYIVLLGENQGGAICAEGGSATNIISMSLTNFRGAFRPKMYIEEEPQLIEEEPIEEPVIEAEKVEEELFQIAPFNTKKVLIIDNIP